MAKSNRLQSNRKQRHDIDDHDEEAIAPMHRKSDRDRMMEKKKKPGKKKGVKK